MAPSAESPTRAVSTSPPKRSETLDRILCELALEFGIPDLDPTSRGWAPASAPNTEGSACCQLVRFLFHRNRVGLDECLRRYRDLPLQERNARTLKTLLKIQKDHTPRVSRVSLNSSRQQNPTSFTSAATSNATTSFNSIFSRPPISAETSFTTTSGDEPICKHADVPS